MTRSTEPEELLRRLLDGEDPMSLEEHVDLAALSTASNIMDTLAATPPTVKPPALLRDSLLGSAAPEASLDSFVARTADFFDVSTRAARALLGSVAHVDAEPWYDGRAMGVRKRDVEAGPALAGANCALFHLLPGARYPFHRHLGDEWCLFLQGRGTEAGREWNPGDLVLNPAGSDHPELHALGTTPFVIGIILHEGAEYPSEEC